MNEPKFRIGDQVTIYGDDNVLYIISDIHDYEVFRENRMEQVFDYELIKIFPVQEKSIMSVESQSELVTYARYNTNMWNTMVEYIRKEHQKNKWYDEPEFISIVQGNMKYVIGGKEITLTTAKKSTADKVKYEAFKTIDEGLDKLNDVNMLLHIVGDNEEKDLEKAKKAVLKKLKKLSS